jgi:hypothetical protein
LRALFAWFIALYVIGLPAPLNEWSIVKVFDSNNDPFSDENRRRV